MPFSPFFGDAPNRRSEIQANLVQAAQQAGEGGGVKFADIVPDRWDTVYVWDGYSADPGNIVFPGINFGPPGTDRTTCWPFPITARWWHGSDTT
jgi:hypothetical protein